MCTCCESERQALPGDRNWERGVFTELRVHGVGNTSRLWLLDDPSPTQVAGDEIAGFFRSRMCRPLVLDPPPPRKPPSPICQDEVLQPPPSPSAPPTKDSADKGEDHWHDSLKWTDVEAYDWGGFNTGGGWKALWLFLLPFTLANVAGWLVAGRNRGGQRVVRLFALGTSTLFVTWLGALAIDLLALQCGWQDACFGRQIWLKPFEWEVFFDPGPRMALALIVPLAVTFFLWKWPGSRSQTKYEGQNKQALEVLAEKDSESAVEQRRWLRNPKIWARESEVRLDAALHGAAALAALGGCMSWAHWRVGGEHWYDLVLWIAGIVLLVASAIVVLTWSPFATGEGKVSRARRLWVRWTGWLAVVFIVIVAAASFVDREYAHVDWDTLTLSTSAEEFSIGQVQAVVDTITGLRSEAGALSDAVRQALFVANGAILGVSMLVLIGIAIGTKPSDVKRNRRLWGRWGPLLSLLAGLAIAATLLAGAGLWLEEWLGDRPVEHLQALGIDANDCAPGETCELIPVGADETDDLSALLSTSSGLIRDVDDVTQLPLVAHLAQAVAPRQSVLSQPVISLPSVYDIAALGFLILTSIMILFYVILEIRLRISIQFDSYPVRRPLCELAHEKLDNRSPEERKVWRKKGVTEMRKSPRLTRVHLLFWVPAVAMFLVGVGLLVDGVFYEFRGTESVVDWVDTRMPWAFTLARWLITAAIVAVATLVYRSYKPEAQESFGGMWDVISFLPRHYHPFAVPSYGVRAVPELAQRITYLTENIDENSPRRCLVSAHSGGVVISLAAIALLEDDVQKKVSLVTYGSPTGALYGRAYPEYFDTERLVEDVAVHLGKGEKPGPETVRWFNLWRLTDWTGGYSFGPARDRFKEYRCSDDGFESTTGYPEMVKHIERIQYDPSCRTLHESPIWDPLAQAIGHTDYLHDPKHIGAEDPRYQNARGVLLRMMP